jgi:cell division protein FtsQ
MTIKSKIVKGLIIGLWVTIGCGVVVLLVAAMGKEEGRVCTGINVVVKGVSNNFFVDKKDILAAIGEYLDGKPEGQLIRHFNLKSLENDLQRNVWVKNARLFFDNNAVLQVVIDEREPVARVFTHAGNTFYIDSALNMLPLSDKYSARLPVFTGFPSEAKVLPRADSALLKDIYLVSTALQRDAFWMAMVEQIDITPQRNFEMVTKIGDHSIVIGDGSVMDDKLNRLMLFYKQVILKTGWQKYSSINVQFAGQVVAKKRGAEDISADSLAALQLLQAMAAVAERQANDSLQIIAQDNEKNTADFSLIQESIQRDDNGDGSNTTETTTSLPVINPQVLKPITASTAPANALQRAAPAPKPEVNAIGKSVAVKSAVQLPKMQTVPPKPKPLAKPVPKPTPSQPKPKTNNDYK